VSEREYKLYDVLVYHDFDSFVEPKKGMNGRDLAFGEDRAVVAVGPPIHEGRAATVILGGLREMPEMEALLDVWAKAKQAEGT